MMDFVNLINRDITVHTDNHKYRGILVDILSNETVSILAFVAGIDEMYVDASKVVAVTVHGREFGKEVVEESE